MFLENKNRQLAGWCGWAMRLHYHVAIFVLLVPRKHGSLILVHNMHSYRFHGHCMCTVKCGQVSKQLTSAH